MNTEKFDTIIYATGMESNNELAHKLKDTGISYKVVGDAYDPSRLHEILTSAVEATIEL